MDKYNLMSLNDNGEVYLHKYLDYLKDKKKYDEDIALGKKLRRTEPIMPNIEEFTIQPSPIYFGMKEIELMGMNWTPLFDEYESSRCIKCNCDIQVLIDYEHQLIRNDELILMVIPTQLERRTAKGSGNEYYKLYIVDEYSRKDIYLQIGTFNKYRDKFELNEPCMILVSTRNGSSSLKHIKPCKTLPQINVENIVFKCSYDEERIISKYLMDYLGTNTLVQFNNKMPRFKVNLNYKLLKYLNSQGYKFELNKQEEEITPMVSGCETIEDYNEFLEAYYTKDNG